MAASLVWVGALCNKQTRSCTSFCATLCTNLVHKLRTTVLVHKMSMLHLVHKQSTHQAQISCTSNGRRTQAHRSPLRGVCALLHSLKHGIWHSCILVFCFLNSFLTILYWAHMMYVYSPFRHHPPPSRQVQKYISWVGGGASDQIRCFNNAKSMMLVHVFLNCFLVPSVSITCLSWVDGIIPRSYINDLVSWNRSFWQVPTTFNYVYKHMHEYIGEKVAQSSMWPPSSDSARCWWDSARCKA